MAHILAVTIRNGPEAALDRILGLLRRRCIPLRGITFGGTEQGNPAPVLLELDTADPFVVGQAIVHLRRLPDVLSVYEADVAPGCEPASTQVSLPQSPAVRLEPQGADCTAAEALIRALSAEGVDVVFGYPGGAILPVYDALLASPIRHVLTRHEQGAVHAAEGYAKATGKVGVAIATSGPGATNLVTGLLDAFMDSVPLVAITGQVPRALLGRDSFQEADVLGITLPTTKHSYIVKDPADLLSVVAEAFHLARSGRPGPVLIDIPKDVAYAKVAYHYPPSLAPHLTQAPPPVDLPGLRQAAALLAGARRPVILCGGGVVASPGAPQLLRTVAEQMQAPVAATLHGLGGISGRHDLFIGMLGMHGLYAANKAVQQADVLLAVGMRFDDRVTGKLAQFAPNAQVVHIDVDQAELGKNVRPLVGLVGDAARVLGRLSAALGTHQTDMETRTDWLRQVRAWHKEHPVWIERRRQFRSPYVHPDVLAQVAAANDGGAPPPPPTPLRAEDVMRAIQVAFGPESLIVTDVGQHQMWAAHFCLRTEPRTFITSGGLGTMGFALPAAMGAWLARPDRTVVAIAGDGGFQMNIQELATVVAEQIPLKIMVVNNGYLGMVRQWQELFYDRRYSAVDMRPGMPDLVRLGEAYGIKSLRVDRPDLLPWAMHEVKEYQGPILVEFVVMPEENVYPMVSPGAANDDMIVSHSPVRESE
ncbi:MAG: acetolactate synthase large subunit [Symbiobacteriaceae bacterium]|nr:acetolactate synthase large subunit [Symbiobacteriaceae bacterium]